MRKFKTCKLGRLRIKTLKNASITSMTKIWIKCHRGKSNLVLLILDEWHQHVEEEELKSTL